MNFFTFVVLGFFVIGFAWMFILLVADPTPRWQREHQDEIQREIDRLAKEREEREQQTSASDPNESQPEKATLETTDTTST